MSYILFWMCGFCIGHWFNVIGVEMIASDESVLNNQRYTSSSGERRIRVHTAAAPVVADLGEMYRNADTGAVVSLFCRLGKI